MPASNVSAFTGPGPFQKAIGSARVEVLATARGDFRVELTRIDLHQISLQAGRETLPRVGRGSIGMERSVVDFLTSADQASGRHCGAALSPGDIVVNGAGSTHHHLAVLARFDSHRLRLLVAGEILDSLPRFIWGSPLGDSPPKRR